MFRCRGRRLTGVVRAADSALGRDPDTLVIAVPGTPPSLDLEQVLTADAELVMANVHEGDLFTYRLRPEGDVTVANVTPGGDQAIDGLLARQWSRDAKDGTVTVRLRQGVRSPFGNTFTAADYLWSWRRRFAHRGIGWYASVVAGIEGPDCIEAVDKWTVRFTLPVDSPVFFRLLAHLYYGGPFDATEARRHATQEDPWAREWLNRNACGFGPYHVEAVTPGVQTLLRSNPAGTRHPAFERVVLRAEADPAKRTAALVAGDVDVAWGIDEGDLAEVEAEASLRVVRVPANKQCYVGLTTSAPPLDDVRVRRALAWATPYADVLREVYRGRARRMRSIVPDGYAGYSPTYRYEDDPQRARGILAEAGLSEPVALSLSFNADRAESARVAAVVGRGWGRAGIRVRLEALANAEFVHRKYGGGLQAFVERGQWPWTGDGAYALWVYLANGRDNFQNAADYSNPAFDDAICRALRMPDSKERAVLVRLCQEMAAEDVPWVQLAWYDWAVPARRDLEGFVWMPDNQLRMGYLRRRPAQA
jgi:peptide/nickel transport system substrate-binding protein